MNSDQQTFRLSKQFAVISFLAIAISAALIFLFFRFETIQIIEETSRNSNESLTIATENALSSHFLAFLKKTDTGNKETINRVALDPLLLDWINKLLRNTNVVRVKIYNRHGRVVYSTKQSQIGNGQEDNEGFQKAMSGVVSTVLIYRDSFNFYDKTTEEDNLVQTYVPIRMDNFPVEGVFEIYSDVNAQVELSNKITILIWLIVTLVMLFLFAFLLMVIKRSENIIENQNRETRERKKLLEFLSAKMINAQEDEKKRIAFELHEDVVQSISGVKMQLERYILSVDKLGESGQQEIRQLTKDIIPDLQQAARRIRLVAMDLRPSSLDDFGLSTALNTLISECHTNVHGMAVKLNFLAAENTVSKEQKALVYRIFKEIIGSVCFKRKLKGELCFSLSKPVGRLVLKVLVESDHLRELKEGELPEFLQAMQERTILSGGDFEILTHLEGQIEVNSVWLD
ncbi:MAG: histidine kinase [Chromatiales bacterium]|nr:histidine kinase [Chromatiales bacterium]